MIRELGGDAGKLDVDVLKIPHHGRQTSSSDDFINAVTPKVAVATGAIIMEPDIYSHYARTGAAVYMDVYDGYVKVTMDGTNVSTEYSRDRGVIVLTAKDKVRLLPALNIPFDLLKTAIETIKSVCSED